MQKFEVGSELLVASLDATESLCGLSQRINMVVGETLTVQYFNGCDDTYYMSNNCYYCQSDLQAVTVISTLPLDMNTVLNGDTVRLISTDATGDSYGHDDDSNMVVGEDFIVCEVDNDDDAITDLHNNWYCAADLVLVSKYEGLVITDVSEGDEVIVMNVDRSSENFDTTVDQIGDTFLIEDIDYDDSSVYSGDEWYYITEVEFTNVDEDDDDFEEEVEDATAFPSCSMRALFAALEANPEAAAPEVEPEYNFLITRDSVTLSIGGDTEVATVDHSNFDSIRALVIDGEYEQAMSLMNVSVGITNWGSGALQIQEGQVVYGGMELTGKLVDRIIDQMLAGDTAFERFAKFLNLTMEQESFKTRERLMDFAAHDKLDLNEDGYVVAFKNVRNDFMDKHSGTFDNNVGKSPSMRRSDVDDNHDNQCSNGLHVCSPEYLKGFWGTSGRTMRVVVDPRDFVAIPYDYNDSKARVCKYTVVEDVTDNISDYF